MRFTVLVFLISTVNLFSQDFTELEVRALYKTDLDSALIYFNSILEEDSIALYSTGNVLFDLLIEDENDSLVVRVGYDLGESLIDWSNIPEAKKVFKKLISYSKTRRLIEGISYGYKGLGDAAQNASEFDTAVHYFMKAELGWKQSKNHQKLGYLYNNIGVAYRKQGNTYMALNYYIKAVEELEKAEDVMALAYINGNIGNIYVDQAEYQKALSHYTIGYDASVKAGNHRMIANLANSVGLAYDKLGHINESFQYFKQAYTESLKSKNQEILLLSLSNLGESYADLNNYDSAIYFINQSLDKSIAVNDLESQTIALLGLGTVYLKQGNYIKAKEKLESGLSLAISSEQSSRAAAAYEDLSIVMESLGEEHQALQYSRSFKLLSDSLLDLRQSNNIKLLQAEFEFQNENEETESQIAQLTAENEIQTLRLRERNLFILISFIAFVAVVIITYLLYHQKIAKKRKEADDLKQKLLRLQLNPHFMFNSLNAIQHMVYKNEDVPKTADYLAKFSHLTRQILELNQHDLITLEDEVTFIKNYLNIQQIRFDEPFQFNFEIAESVELHSTFIPPMITQPFLENAIEHGIIDKYGEGKIQVQITTTRKHLIQLIEDNGVGREVAAFRKRTSEHRSMATEITKDRLVAYERSTGDHVSMEIDDVIKDELVVGTRVLFLLPLKVEA
mgnify:CR=1 FL=1